MKVAILSLGTSAFFAIGTLFPSPPLSHLFANLPPYSSPIFPPLPLLRLLPNLANKAYPIRLHSFLRFLRIIRTFPNRRWISDLSPRYHSSLDSHVSIKMSCRLENARGVFEKRCGL